jgi:hypothetical protein
MWKLVVVRMAALLMVVLEIIPLRVEAQDAATIADVRRVIVGMKLVGVTNSAEQSQAIVLTWYYIGRLEGRAPKLTLKKCWLRKPAV